MGPGYFPLLLGVVLALHRRHPGGAIAGDRRRAGRPAAGAAARFDRRSASCCSARCSSGSASWSCWSRRWSYRRWRAAKSASARSRRAGGGAHRLLGRGVRLRAAAALAVVAGAVGRADGCPRQSSRSASPSRSRSKNILYCFLGVFLGTVVGVLPGIGPVTTVAMLLPISFTLDPVSAMILLAGIYYGAQYGGSTTAILVNIPGEASSVVTTLDGHQMARQGRAGPALGIAAIGSFFAGCVATLLICFAAPPLAAIALTVRPGGIFLAHGVRPDRRGRAGARIGRQGDRHGGARPAARARRQRRELRHPPLHLRLPGSRRRRRVRRAVDGDLRPRRGRLQSRTEGARGRSHRATSAASGRRGTTSASAFPAILRGTTLGSLLGVLPGGGALLAAFGAYTLEKKVAKPPRHFGDGDIRGVAAPESANNAGAQTSFIPMLTLGIPSNPDHGDDDRRADDPRHRAGPARHDRPARAVLGADRLDVDRQSHAGRAQPAAGRPVGASCCAFPTGCCSRRSSAFCCIGALRGQQQRVRRLRDGVLRDLRLPLPQARLRAGAARSSASCSGR